MILDEAIVSVKRKVFFSSEKMVLVISRADKDSSAFFNSILVAWSTTLQQLNIT